MLHHRGRPGGPLLALLVLALSTAVVAGGSIVAAAPASARTSCVPPPVAHRGGAADAPENTMPAFRRAFRAGAHRLEIDVRFTDGDVPVLMHDATVDRTTNGHGAVAALTLAQVRALDAGRWFSHAYRGTRVPTLYQALQLAKRHRAGVMIELKTVPTDAQLKQVLSRVRWLRMGRSITVTSFLGDALRAVHAVAPDLRTALVDNPRYRQPSSVLQFGRTYLINQASVTKTRAARWRRAGIAVRPWTVDTVRGWTRMAHDRADAIVTNRPSAYLDWARRRCR